PSERLAGYAERLREAFPALPVKMIAPLGAGDNNDVLLVNGNLVFRFPRHAYAAQALVTETSLLRAIADRLPLAIPRPRYVAQGVVGYERIAGEDLARERLHALPAADQQAIAEQLAAFLAALHAIPAGELPPEARVERDTPGEWAELAARVERQLY